MFVVDRCTRRLVYSYAACLPFSLILYSDLKPKTLTPSALVIFTTLKTPRLINLLTYLIREVHDPSKFVFIVSVVPTFLVHVALIEEESRFFKLLLVWFFWSVIFCVWKITVWNSCSELWGFQWWWKMESTVLTVRFEKTVKILPPISFLAIKQCLQIDQRTFSTEFV